MTQLDQDIDTLRDVFMTNSQREALARVQALASDHARLQATPTRAWSAAKPAAPGAYWVRGYAMGDREEMALVEIREVAGVLCSNLHGRNSDDDGAFDALEAHCDDFEWFGPLAPAVQP